MSKRTRWHGNASCKFPSEAKSFEKLTPCARNFGPSLVPLLQVGFRGIVQTDAGFRAHLTTVQNHKDTCGPATWDAMLNYAKKLRGAKTKVAFFSSTPQGGGVALMRHALVRFSRLMGVDLTWYGM
jgi:alpha,alpha-trehalose phosphorylase (configuration-retaining)